MGKRSGLFFAILLVASVVQVELPVAIAQTSGSDTFDCPSGVISSVDGSCVSEEQAPIQGLGQLGAGSNGTSGTSGNGVGVGAAGGLSGQYPGLRPLGINRRGKRI